MFRLLLKHDWRSLRGILGLLSIVCVGAGIVGGFAMRTMILLSEQRDPSAFLIVITMFAIMVSFISMGITVAGSLFFCIWRFYKSRYSDEGYMTFTLPATAHQILLSSLVSTLLAVLCMSLVLVLGIGILMCIAFTAIPNFYADAARELPRIWNEIRYAFREESGPFLSMLLYSPVAMVAEVIVLMLSVTIGSVAVRKLKVLAAIGIYYGINVVVSLANTIIMVLSGPFSSNSIDFYNQFFLYPTVLMLLLGVGGYFLMHYLASKKLNLP